jgi:hypothetical protein
MRIAIDGFTFDMSQAAPQNISRIGIGFRPDALLVFCGLGSAGTVGSIGTSDGITTGCNYWGFGTDVRTGNFLVVAGTDSSNFWSTATNPILQDDGYTIVMASKSGTPTGLLSFYVICLR